MGYPVTLNGRTYTLADFEGQNYVDGLPDAFEDFVTHAGNLYSTTSTTSNSIGTGSKTFTVESSKPYQVGTPLRITDSAAPSTNWIDAIVTAYSGTTLTVDAVAYAGSGTKTSWNINIGGGGTSYTGTLPVAQGGTGATTAAAARTNLDTYSKSEADSRFLNISGEGDSISSNITLSGNLSVDGGSIKLDGNYPNGVNNVALGNTALDTASGANGYSVAIGNAALTAMSTGGSNVGVGHQAGYSINSGANNTAIGTNALIAATTHNFNVAVGSSALQANTASENVAMGYEAAKENTTGFRHVAIGYRALKFLGTSNNNTAVGYQAATATSTGEGNAAFGRNALLSNVAGDSNTAIGQQSLNNNTADKNTAVGYQAGYTNNTGVRNAYFGYFAGKTNNSTDNLYCGYMAGYLHTGANSCFVGTLAGQANTSGASNTFVGTEAGYSANTGSNNTFVGRGSGYHVTSGADNTILGRYNGNQGGLDIRTSSNYIVLSDGDGEPRASYRHPQSGWFFNNPGNNTIRCLNETTTAANAYGPFIQFTQAAPNNTTQYFIACADNSTTRFRVYSNGNVVNSNNSYGSISDAKLKENIVDASSQWDDIKALTVRKYSMKADNLDTPNMLGVIAQEVEAAGMGGLVFETPDTDPDTKEDLGTVTKQVNYSILYMKAVKALQEAMDRIETLEAKVAALEAN